MAEELLVTLNRYSESTGFGFSLLGTAGLPHVIFDIVENSPAADSGKVEAGDVILRVNEVDVNRFTTKEVLKCLRLSSDPVTLQLRRDPEIKAQLRRLLSRTDTIEDEIDGSTLASISHKLNSVGSNSGIGAAADLVKRASSSSTSTSSRSCSKSSSASPEPIISSPTPQNSTAATAVATTQQQQHSRSNGSCSDASDLEALIPAAKKNSKDEEHKWEPLGSDASKRPTNPPRFEAYMMTGDLMLNLSRTQQTSGLLPKQKKVDSLRYSNHANTHHHHRHHHHHHHHHHHQNNHHNNNNNNNDEAHHHHHQHNNHQQAQEPPPQQHNSVPTSPSVGQQQQPHRRSGNSASSSPVKLNRQESGCSNDGGSSGHASFVRTSRSEDQLQVQKDPAMLAAELEMDEDVASSLNTLLDARPSADQQPGEERPEGDRIVWTYNAPAGGVVGGGGDPQQQQQQPCHSSSSFGDASSSSSSSSSSSCSHPNSHTSCSQSSSSNGGGSSSSSSSSTEASSPQRSLSPASPTSVSSSVMSSNSGSRRFPVPGNAAMTHQNQTQQQPQQQQQQQQQQLHHSSSAPKQQVNGELSQSEVISNMSSPDYNDEETMDILSARDNMMVSDPSDSDSTILASEPPQRRVSKQQKKQQSASTTEQTSNEQQHRIIIQVKGPNGGTVNSNSNCANSNNSPRGGRRRLGSAGPDSIPPITNNPPVQHSPPVQHRDCYYQELHEDEQHHTSPPHSADEESDIESLHSYHYSPKAVDMPSAIRLAKRLYSLDGFKKSDVSRHLSKNNDFSKAVADEYLRYFNFENDTLDVALRKFLAQFSLTGETQERERVLVHFSKRYLDCNPGSFNSQDAVHTLTCAIMLLNTDLHGPNIGKKMTVSEFIENLVELNDGEDFPKEVLKQLYGAIKSFPLEWALDEEAEEGFAQTLQQGDSPVIAGNPFIEVPNISSAKEYKKGYVMRKSCFDPDGKKTPLGKRGWKMYHCTLKELVLYLDKDEHSFHNNSSHNVIAIHHALATKATDYTKRQHVFRLQTANQAEYLFQTSDSKELQSWIDTINFVCASFSAQPLASAVGSQRKFQRPVLPCSHTKLNPREQLRDHEDRVCKLEADLDEHRRHPPEKGAKSQIIQNYKEKDAYLHHELKRYKTYAYLLRSKLPYTENEPSLVDSSIGEVDESGAFMNMDMALVPPPVPDRPATNRYSYRAAIYNRNLLNGQEYSGDIG
uniref:SEC7 domain-containing protein n=1 Tax=Trichogramma kaykai TaxID=54128 RepID=A0ABD2WS20_9HYME